MSTVVSKSIRSRVSVNIDTVEFSLRGMEFVIPGAKNVTLRDPHGHKIMEYGNRVPMKGKFDAHNIHVRTKESGRVLEFEGSLFAFLHGQNIYTSDNLSQACRKVIKRVMVIFKLKPPEELQQQWFAGDISLQRIDLAVNFLLRSESEVVGVLKQIRRQLVEQHGVTRTCGTSVYWAPRDGVKYSISFYAKGAQMRRSKKYVKLPGHDVLLKECENILRMEVRLRASELRELGLDQVGAWKEGTAEKVFRKYMGKLKLLSVTRGPISDEELEMIPDRMRPVYALHKAGVALDKLYSTRSCQRHVSTFKQLGIDLRCPNQPIDAIKSLKRFLSPKKVINDAPEWMKDAGIVPPRAVISTKSQAVKVRN